MNNTRLEREAKAAASEVVDYIDTLISEVEELEEKVGKLEDRIETLETQLNAERNK